MGVPTSWGERLETHYPGGLESIQQLGEKAGKKFDFSVQLSDTMDSWRLAMWAENQGQGERLLSVVGRQYFEEAKPLADHAALLEAVEEVGLDRTEAEAVLESDRHLDEVMGHYRWALEVAGIRSIPGLAQLGSSCKLAPAPAALPQAHAPDLSLKPRSLEPFKSQS